MREAKVENEERRGKGRKRKETERRKGKGGKR